MSIARWKEVVDASRTIAARLGAAGVLSGLELARNAAADPRTRAYDSTPRARISGPTAMNTRGPYFAARLPNRGEKKIRNREPGIPAAPAAAAVYPSVPC